MTFKLVGYFFSFIKQIELFRSFINLLYSMNKLHKNRYVPLYSTIIEIDYFDYYWNWVNSSWVSYYWIYYHIKSKIFCRTVESYHLWSVVIGIINYYWYWYHKILLISMTLLPTFNFFNNLKLFVSCWIWYSHLKLLVSCWIWYSPLCCYLMY